MGSQVNGVDRSRLPGRGTVGKLEEEEEPATERRREYTNLGLDLGEREEQVACHASALAMTDEARRFVEIEALRSSSLLSAAAKAFRLSLTTSSTSVDPRLSDSI